LLLYKEAINAILLHFEEAFWLVLAYQKSIFHCQNALASIKLHLWSAALARVIGFMEPGLGS